MVRRSGRRGLSEREVRSPQMFSEAFESGEEKRRNCANVGHRRMNRHLVSKTRELVTKRGPLMKRNRRPPNQTPEATAASFRRPADECHLVIEAAREPARGCVRRRASS